MVTGTGGNGSGASVVVTRMGRVVGVLVIGSDVTVDGTVVVMARVTTGDVAESGDTVTRSVTGTVTGNVIVGGSETGVVPGVVAGDVVTGNVTGPDVANVAAVVVVKVAVESGVLVTNVSTSVTSGCCVVIAT